MDPDSLDNNYSRTRNFSTMQEENPEQTSVTTSNSGILTSRSTTGQVYSGSIMRTSQMSGYTSSSPSSRTSTPIITTVDQSFSSPKSRIYTSTKELYNEQTLHHALPAKRREVKFEDIQTTTGNFSPTNDEDLNVSETTYKFPSQEKELKDETETTKYYTSTMKSSSPTSRTKFVDIPTYEHNQNTKNYQFGKNQSSAHVTTLLQSSGGSVGNREHFTRRGNENDDLISSSTNLATQQAKSKFIDDYMTHQIGEKRELIILNSRFEDYLNKTKRLVHLNTNLRRQVDDAYRRYMGRTTDFDEEVEKDINYNEDNRENRARKRSPNEGEKAIQQKNFNHPQDKQLINLRNKITDEVRHQTSVQIRVQRADHDIKFYKNEIKCLNNCDLTENNKLNQMKQELEHNVYELEQLKKQYDKREDDLEKLKQLYDEYMKKIVHFTDEYDTITFERMKNENQLYNLQEQIAFQQEYQNRIYQEYEHLEKFESDFNQEFNTKELQNVVEQIRHDYEDYNQIRIEELENLYKTRLNDIKEAFQKQEELKSISGYDLEKSVRPKEFKIMLDTTKEQHRNLLEQNYVLKEKLEQLEQDLRGIIDNNKRVYESSDLEYQQLQNELPELENIILRLRENAVGLWAEINTYRCLLLSLLSPSHSSLTGSTEITDESVRTQVEPKYIPSIITPPLPKATREEFTEKFTTKKYRAPIATSISTSSKSIIAPSATTINTETQYDQQERSQSSGKIMSIDTSGKTNMETRRELITEESDNTAVISHPYSSPSLPFRSAHTQHMNTATTTNRGSHQYDQQEQSHSSGKIMSIDTSGKTNMETRRELTTKESDDTVVISHPYSSPSLSSRSAQVEHMNTATTTNRGSSTIISVAYSTGGQKFSQQQDYHRHSPSNVIQLDGSGMSISEQSSHVVIPMSMAKKITTSSSNDNTDYRDVTMARKILPYCEQYRDEATGFIVHIEDGIIWVRI
ncbi:unnamed protein product [Didymodactylos carnosus]|uniref:Uncharacterized protein n=3 Tax=Didymodactylos carnosus TaxID=1234261 RepID=A0A813U1I7_9BILA|nr:unnamed protein product [Didymodactylos carnosus]CAF3608333.1 unnamed protein product [Didymodactylos carnosus]